MMNSKSGIVTVEAAIFLAAVTIALVAGFSYLADQIYVPAVYAAGTDGTLGTSDDVLTSPASGVLADFITDMKSAIR